MPALPKGAFFGTPHYLAPEVVAETPFGAPIDCWAVGCVLYYMLIGDLPFDEQGQEDLSGPEHFLLFLSPFNTFHVSSIYPLFASAHGFGRLFKRIAETPVHTLHPAQWEALSEGVRGLILGLLEKDPGKRVTMGQAVANGWMSAVG